MLLEINNLEGTRKAKAFYSSGTLKEEANFTNGKIDGLHKEYDENSKLLKESFYVKGTLVDVREQKKSGLKMGEKSNGNTSSKN